MDCLFFRRHITNLLVNVSRIRLDNPNLPDMSRNERNRKNNENNKSA